MMPTLVSVKAFLCIFLFSDIASAVVNQNQDPDALTNANPLRKVDLAVYPAVRRRRQFASPWEQMTNTLKYEARKMYFPRHLELHVGDTAFTIFAPRNQGPTTSVPVPPPAPARQKKSRKFRIRFGIGFPGNNAERNDEQDSIQSSENAEEVVPEEEPADEEITRNLSQISVFNLIQRSFRRQSSIQSTADPMSSEANPEQLPTQQIQTRPVAKSNRVFGFDLTKKITMCYTTQTDEEILDWLATHWKGYYDEALHNCQHMTEMLLRHLCPEAKIPDYLLFHTRASEWIHDVGHGGPDEWIGNPFSDLFRRIDQTRYRNPSHHDKWEISRQ